MQIVVKVLKGDEFSVEAQAEETIYQLKSSIQRQKNVPVTHQKLLLAGRALRDDKPVAFYPTITDGTRLTLIVMQPDSLKDTLYRSFRKFYDEQMSEHLTSEFLADFDLKMKQMTLDDIEKIASGLINQNHNNTQ